ncbi:MAG: DEAD/DEAH box helicase, partial [Chloroflexi bacterium]|nr:DEAD/DEAH box helicase [Chloroflexota bacterium]
MFRGLSQLVDDLPQFRAIAGKLGAGGRESAAILGAARALLLGALWQELRGPVLVVTPLPEDARRLYDQLTGYWGESLPIYHFAELEALPFERLTPDSATVHQRLRALGALAGVYHDQPSPLVVTSASGVALKTLPPRLFQEMGQHRVVRRGERSPMEAMLKAWTALGYRMERIAEVPGTASRRGGIVDVFPPGQPFPLRLDFWGDFVESIKTYDPGSQRSLAAVDQVMAPPAQELLPSLADSTLVERAIAGLDYSRCADREASRIGEELALLMAGHQVEDASFYLGFFNRHSLLDYLAQDALLVLDRPSEVEGAFHEMDSRTREMERVKGDRGELPGGFPSPYFGWSEVEAALKARGRLLELVPWGGDDRPSFPFLPAPSFHGQLGPFMDQVSQRAREGQRVVIATSHAQRLREVMADAGIGVRSDETLEELPSPGSVTIVHGSLPEGWVMEAAPAAPPLERGGFGGAMPPPSGGGTQRTSPPQSPTPPRESPDRSGFPLREGGHRGSGVPTPEGVGFSGPMPPPSGGGTALFTDAEVFGASKILRPRRQYAYHVPSMPAEITPGAYVVHVDHGVARFVGTITMTDTGEAKEYLVLEYGEDDKLYVPVEQSHRVGLYVAPSDAAPSLSRLGGQEWAQTKARVKRAAREMAEELIALYSRRQAAPGIPFGEDTPWQEEVEDAFPYVETPDQMRAILQVKEDMESGRPMDRLVCGDVGYGKTEVALRAAFKAVAYGYQVAVLVPTTVLAQQHYVTFTERLSPYPLRVEVLSRFRSGQEQREVVEGLGSGRVDICIGTHRLLQKDVRFKNLGLVVVDEEHRFGVAHKERLKQMRTEVDVLTLTATPIPRTLNMALSGIRDMSAMETPPEER